MPNRGFYGFSFKSEVAEDLPTFEDLIIPGMASWVDVSKILTNEDNTSITQFADRCLVNLWSSSGSGGTFFRLDDISLPSIEVSTNTFSQNNVNLANPCTVMYVARMKAGGQKKRALCSTTVNWLLGYWNGNMDSYYANGFVNQGSAADNNLHLYVGRQTGSISTIWRDGTQIASNGSGVAAPGKIQVGGYGASGGATEWSNFYFYEFIAYNRDLSDSEVTAKMDNLKTKWGIT